MMKIFMFIIFLIPLINCWWLIMFTLIILSGILLFLPFTIYYSSMSFGYGMDVISYCMIILTVWILFLMIMASSKILYLYNYNKEFLLILLILLFLLVMTFSTSNLFLFYLYFESSMIPTLFLIFGWGYQPERFAAGLYLLFYTLFASFPLLVCIFYIYNNYFTLFYFLIDLSFFNYYIYLSLILAFLVKMPMVFVHFWLPKAHVEAPVSGSMILAGILLKLGGYGLYRVILFLKFIEFNYFWIIVSLFGGFMVGLLCLSQVDIKSMIAYSSVAHMGLVISGIMTFNIFGLEGSLILMVGHGLCSSGLFALANIIYERSHSRSLLINKGYINFMPTMSLFWFLLCVNNMASPISLNFLGEILLINSILSWSTFTMLFLAFSSFLSCCYSIYLYSITQHGILYSGLKYESSGNIREFLILIFHLLPLNFLFMMTNIFIMWF
uniref:NADH-ubiquinone oxidoreductase chain 4 n=1 Tax=Grypocephalus pallipectus TaxID=2813436 RepID=A0A8T9ZXJ6_9HEMI|nr:NADH dehydrogenase subunit 4 [Grypocephalus pallipectus]UNA71182.1 NADH dehydrogenase subunit 4 [Grypocephalus pallipectus]UPL65774.1 NADH dehydrogenase subunit 4 [Grypocephalus pallipectus]